MTIGSKEMVTINKLAQIAINLSEKNVKVKQVSIIGRNSDNKLIKAKLVWGPKKHIIGL
jgi:GDP-D-mannose 3', 5'-epimerase